jgi:hypothetical protein
MKHLMLFLVFFLMVMASGCQKDNDKPVPGKDYMGTLKLEYSRDTPDFMATTEMDVTMNKDGDVLITEPDQVDYSGVEEVTVDEDLIKVEEIGTVTITSLSGEYKMLGGEEYLSINASTLIDGTIQLWGWDEDLGWVSGYPDPIPFSVDDPVDSPMNFLIDDAVIAGAHIGATIQGVAPFGSQTFKWTLTLSVAL